MQIVGLQSTRTEDEFANEPGLFFRLGARIRPSGCFITQAFVAGTTVDQHANISIYGLDNLRANPGRQPGYVRLSFPGVSLDCFVLAKVKSGRYENVSAVL